MEEILTEESLVSTVRTALIGASFGAFAGLVANAFMTKWRFWRLYRRLSFEPQQKGGSLGGARVVNDYICPIRSAYAYITVKYDYEDILNPLRTVELS